MTRERIGNALLGISLLALFLWVVFALRCREAHSQAWTTNKVRYAITNVEKRDWAPGELSRADANGRLVKVEQPKRGYLEQPKILLCERLTAMQVLDRLTEWQATNAVEQSNFWAEVEHYLHTNVAELLIK